MVCWYFEFVLLLCRFFWLKKFCEKIGNLVGCMNRFSRGCINSRGNVVVPPSKLNTRYVECSDARRKVQLKNSNHDAIHDSWCQLLTTDDCMCGGMSSAVVFAFAFIFVHIIRDVILIFVIIEHIFDFLEKYKIYIQSE